MGYGFVADRAPIGPLGVDGVLEVAGGGQDAGVDDEGVAVGRGRLVVVVGVADSAAVCEEDEAAQVVEGFATVQLAPDPPAESLVGEPAQGVEGAQQLAVLDQGFGQGVLAGAGLELGYEQGGRYVALLEGPSDAQQVVPVLGDQVDLGVLGEERPGGRPVLVGPPLLSVSLGANWRQGQTGKRVMAWS